MVTPSSIFENLRVRLGDSEYAGDKMKLEAAKDIRIAVVVTIIVIVIIMFIH